MTFAMVAQFKFVATYLVPSAYPSFLMIVSAIAAFFVSPLAAFGPPPPGSVEPWLLNLFAVIGVLTLLGTFALVCKKLLGRQPSLNEILSGLVSTKSFAEHKEEQRLRSVGLEQQISAARHSFDERLNTDLVRTENAFKEVAKLNERREKVVSDLSGTVSRLQERTETHLRKLDQYDTKFDNLLREVSAAAARGVRQAQQQQD